jgi:cytochrome c553
LLAFGKRKLGAAPSCVGSAIFRKSARELASLTNIHGREQCHDQIGRIGDQREDYLLKALRGYKSNERKGYDPAMNEVAQEISDDEIVAIAHYVAHFK